MAEKLRVWSNLEERFLELEGTIIEKTLENDVEAKKRTHISNGVSSETLLQRKIYKITFGTLDNKIVEFLQIIDKNKASGKEVENYYRTEMELGSDGEYHDRVVEILNK